MLADAKWSAEPMGEFVGLQKLPKVNFHVYSNESSSRRRSSSKTSSAPINTPSNSKSRDGSKNRSHSGTPKSRDSSPRVNNEEIPLENLNSTPSSRCSSRSHTPSRLATESCNGLSVAKEVIPQEEHVEMVAGQSEETSFIASEKKKAKGAIETV